MNKIEEALDPENWDQSRELAHQMVDNAIDYLKTVRKRPVWQQMPREVEDKFKSRLPKNPSNFELVAPTKINIVSFRFVVSNRSIEKLKEVNIEIMLRLQETGIAALSDTTVHDDHCLRVAICNHRTKMSDLKLLADQIVKLGNIIINE